MNRRQLLLVGLAVPFAARAQGISKRPVRFILGQTAAADIGLPPPSQPIWSRVTFDGTNLSWSFSRDGEIFSTVFTVLAADNLSNVDRVGPVAFFQQPTHPTWPSAYHILSWQLASL